MFRINLRIADPIIIQPTVTDTNIKMFNIKVGRHVVVLGAALVLVFKK